MKKITILTLVAVFAAAIAGCSTTGTNGNVKVAGTNVNSNTAVVVNANQVPVTNTNTTGATTGNSNWNANITREEYDKNKDDYANRAKSAGSTIGSGANDGWLWAKTKTALATTNDLRDSTINVDVNNDVVTLKGSVATAEQKAKAESVAKGIDGVKSVKNELTVKAGDSLTNQMTSGSDGTKKDGANSNTKK